jgi:hypothetical protein
LGKNHNPLAIAGKGVIIRNYTMAVPALPTGELKIGSSYPTLPKHETQIGMGYLTLPTREIQIRMGYPILPTG